MDKKTSFLVPVGIITVVQEIKRSRFICTVGRATGKKLANEFVNNVKALYPDARHHCYAFIAGCPLNTSDIGMSDDGEPQGTAGKPMLSILKYSKIGEIVVVVTRYFGGTKLGTGGLVRAYSSSVQLALQNIQLIEFIKLKTFQIAFPFSYESSIRYLFASKKVDIKKITYLDNVQMVIKFPETILDELLIELKNKTRGEAIIF